MDQPGADTTEKGERSRLREYLSTWLSPTVSIVLIMIMAVRPYPSLLPSRRIDKYLHALAYGVPAILSYRSFFSTRGSLNCAPAFVRGK